MFISHAIFLLHKQYLLFKVHCQSFAGMINQNSERSYKCSIGIFLYLILWEDFLSVMPKFLWRTRCVRWWNPSATGGKSATKTNAGKTPRGHINVLKHCNIDHSLSQWRSKPISAWQHFHNRKTHCHKRQCAFDLYFYFMPGPAWKFY